MRKANEYAEYIIKYESDKKGIVGAIGKVIIEMVKEIGELVEERNITKRTALKSIIKEQDRKWVSICNKTGLIGMEKTFMNYLEEGLPELLKEAGMWEGNTEWKKVR